MNIKEKNYFQEYIDTILTEDGSSKNLLIIKHNNLLFPDEKKLDEEKIIEKGYYPVFHRYQEKNIQKPYDPYLEVK